MKTLTLSQRLTSLFISLGAGCQLTVAQSSPDDQAWIAQSLIAHDGTIITTETALDTETGTMTSIPLEGLVARFDLWVYPLIGFNDLEDVEPRLLDTNIVGIIPTIDLSFTGLDPFEHPRTRADWSHQIDVTVNAPPTTTDNEDIPAWVNNFIIRKKFLHADHLNSQDRDNLWIDGGYINLNYGESNEVLQFISESYPSNTSDPDKWSGLIEYEVLTADVAGSPIPLFSLSSLQVRVWPKWDAMFENFPEETVSSIPENLEVRVNDIYPGTEKVIVEYIYEDQPPVTIIEENWTAVASQERLYPLNSLANLTEPGDYHIQVRCVFPHASETSGDLLPTEPVLDDQGNQIPVSTLETNPTITIGAASIIIKGGIHSLD